MSALRRVPQTAASIVGAAARPAASVARFFASLSCPSVSSSSSASSALLASASRTMIRARPVQLSCSSSASSSASSLQRRCFSDEAAKPAATDAAPAADAAAAAAPPTVDIAAIEKKLAEAEKLVAEQKKKIEEHEKTAKEWKDELLRAHAEMHNVRRIAKTDVSNANRFALTSIGKKLVDVVDNMQRALSSVKGLHNEDGSETEPGTLQDSEAMLRGLYDGVAMTEKILSKSLAENGFKKIESIGQKVDPNLHNVLFTVEDPSKPSGTITQVLKEGYMLHDRVIRPADVGTVKGSTAKPAATTA